MVGGKLGLLEQSTEAGVFRFDTGPSLLTLPQVFAELFDATGDPLESSLTLEPLDPVTRYRFADGTRLDTAADPELTSARMDAAFGPGAGADWRRLASRAERIWRAVRGPFLESTVDGFGDLARLAVRLRRPARHRARPDAALARPALPGRPAAADAARPVRHVHRLRPAPGAGRARGRPVRRAGLRRLVPARRPAHPRRRAGPAG